MKTPYLLSTHTFSSRMLIETQVNDVHKIMYSLLTDKSLILLLI